MNIDYNSLDFGIYFGEQCNNCCIMCTNVMPSKKKADPADYQIERIKKIIQKYNGNIPFFSITGGEPTLYPKDLYKVIKFIERNTSAEIKLITNARMFSSVSFSNLFKSIDSKRMTLITEIHGREKTHDNITRVSGSYIQTIKGIENIQKILRWHIEQRIVIQRMNVMEIKEIVKKGYQLGIRDFTFFPIDIIGNAAVNKETTMITYSEIVPYVLDTINFLKNTVSRITLLHFPKCVLPKQYWDYANGESVIKRRIDALDSCKECSLFEECAKPWKSYVHFIGDFEFTTIREQDLKNDFQPIFLRRKTFFPGSSIVYVVETVCNQRCVFCTSDKFLKIDSNDPNKVKKNYEKPTRLAEFPHTEIIKNIVTNKASQITLMGGEPTLNPNLAYYIKFAKKYSQIVSLNTNGSLLYDNYYVKKLKSSGLDQMIISLHAHNSELGEKVSKIKGNFEKTVKGIHNSIRNKLDVTLVHVLYKGNYTYFIDYVNYIKEEFLKEARENRISLGLSVSMIKPNQLTVEKNKELVQSYTETEPFFVEGIKLASKYGLNLGIENFPLCLIPQEFRKYSVEYHDIKSKNGFNKWLKQRFENNERDEFGYESKECKLCKMRDFCQKLLKDYYDIYGAEELKAIE